MEANPAQVADAMRTPPQGDLPTPDAETRPVIRLAFAAVLAGLALWLAHSYLVAFGWAVVIAVSVWPFYRRLAPRLGAGRVLAPLLVTLLLAVLLIVPLAMILVEVGAEAQFFGGLIDEVERNGMPVPVWVENLPLLSQQVDGWWQAHLIRPETAHAMLQNVDAQTMAGWSTAVGGALATRALVALVTFMALFALLRDGDWFAARVLTLSERWLGRPGGRLARKMAIAVRGTVNGTLLVAIGEGLLIGIGYFVAGVPHAVLFTAATMVFAMLPLGAWIAFSAAAITLLVTGGSGLAAAAVAGWGAAVMLIGDNFVQPALIGGSIRLPFLWALVGILGGIEIFGLIGLFLGPVLMAAMLTIWRDWLADA